MDILVRRALESLANNRGIWNGEREVISADIVNKCAKSILALLDAPVASDAREVWNKLLDHFEKNRWHLNETFCLRLFESALSDCERKAREETARKCAEAAVRFFNLAPAGELANDFIRRIMEATNE